MKCQCDCCRGVQAVTPLSIENRAGLGAIKYRVGSYRDFYSSILAELSTHRVNFEGADSTAPLRDGLRTRDPSDPAIALLDAWAVVGDVLTFYQERLANEAYVHTATEYRSLLELAELVGYHPKPGVAATAFLAFNV